jgi:hypothetical protein
MYRETKSDVGLTFEVDSDDALYARDDREVRSANYIDNIKNP